MMDRAQDSLLGIFRDADSVVQAVDGLRGAGITGDDVEVLSDSPYPEGAFGEGHHRHRLFVFPFVGAACGLAVGLMLTISTQISYPMITGGKPVLSIPPMINVMYEGTMLGAILFTIMGIIFESRLPNLSPKPYDPRISEGYLGVLVRRTGGRVSAAERVLRDAGAIDVVGGGGAVTSPAGTSP
jgi:hypothetical protein